MAMLDRYVSFWNELLTSHERVVRYYRRPYEALATLKPATSASVLVGRLEYYAMLTVVQGSWAELDA